MIVLTSFVRKLWSRWCLMPGPSSIRWNGSTCWLWAMKLCSFGVLLKNSPSLLLLCAGVFYWCFFNFWKADAVGDIWCDLLGLGVLCWTLCYELSWVVRQEFFTSAFPMVIVGVGVFGQSCLVIVELHNSGLFFCMMLFSYHWLYHSRAVHCSSCRTGELL